MAFDLQRVVEAAARAALEDSDHGRRQPQRRRRVLSAPRALLIGAGLLTAGRLATSSRGRDLVEGLQDRLDEFRERQLADRDDEPEDEYEDEPEDEYDDEPEDEYEDDEEYDEDAEPEDESDDEPEDEYDDDEEEDEDEEDEPPRKRASSGGRAGSGRSRR